VQFKGNEAFYEKMLRKFVNELPAAWTPFGDAVADMESLMAFVHKIKGIAGNLSVNEAYQSAQELEIALRDDKPDVELYRAFTEACDAFREAMRTRAS
jgi:HPt (histidine-containing phosphotransfer) domain-containing protein